MQYLYLCNLILIFNNKHWKRKLISSHRSAVTFSVTYLVKGPFFVLRRCEQVPDTGASRRGGVDSRGQGMAAEEPGSCPSSVAEAYQPRGRHAALFGLSKQGEASNN